MVCLNRKSVCRFWGQGTYTAEGIAKFSCAHAMREETLVSMVLFLVPPCLIRRQKARRAWKAARNSRIFITVPVMGKVQEPCADSCWQTAAQPNPLASVSTTTHLGRSNEWQFSKFWHEIHQQWHFHRWRDVNNIGQTFCSALAEEAELEGLRVPLCPLVLQLPWCWWSYKQRPADNGHAMLLKLWTLETQPCL